jgi:hypothetical protein
MFVFASSAVFLVMSCPSSLWKQTTWIMWHWIVVQLETIVHTRSCVKSSSIMASLSTVDGPAFADKVHFNHPIIGGHLEQVQPSKHGVLFTSSELHSLWKEIQKEYD